MAVTIRTANVGDMLSVQNCNLESLPENYQLKFFMLHFLFWPHLQQVAVNVDGEAVGYVLSKLEDNHPSTQTTSSGQQGTTSSDSLQRGHITSLAVDRKYRRGGIANSLIKSSQRCVGDIYECDSVTLHVRVTNRAAFSLYSESLGYYIRNVEESYYADKEDACLMKYNIKQHDNSNKTTSWLIINHRSS